MKRVKVKRTPETIGEANYRDGDTCSSCLHYEDFDDMCDALIDEAGNHVKIDTFCVCDLFERDDT